MLKLHEIAAVAGVFFASLLSTSISLHNAEITARITGAEEKAFYTKIRSATPKIDENGVLAESFLIATASGEILASRNSDAVLPIASITKIMTAMLLESIPDSFDVWISERAKSVEPKLSKLPAGSIISREAAITLLVVESDNDIAEAIAESAGQALDVRTTSPRDSFINAMNNKAAELGMTSTHFENPSGLDSEGHRSSARDLMALSRHIETEFPEFWEITRNPLPAVRTRDGTSYAVKSSNLIKDRPGLLGAKTGLSDDALGALLLKFRNDYFPEDLIIIILRSRDRFGDAERLMNAIDAAFKVSEK